MNAEVKIGSKEYKVDLSKGLDISIPLNFNGEQPNTYGVEKAISKPYQHEKFIGDTREGGPCNFETYIFTPHCNGTHTECIGHITNKRVDVLRSLKEEFFPAALISIFPENTNENYIPRLNKEDLVITKQALEDKLKIITPTFLKALIVRTLPNFENKKRKDYMQDLPPFFSIEAMEYIVSLGVEHLFVDVPSVDRLLDEGCLSAHNIFWETKSKEFNPKTKQKTITEMIFVPDSIEDGRYLLNLQIPAFISDAAPSRPILYKINDL